MGKFNWYNCFLKNTDFSKSNNNSNGTLIFCGLGLNDWSLAEGFAAFNDEVVKWEQDHPGKQAPRPEILQKLKKKHQQFMINNLTEDEKAAWRVKAIETK